jgi:hypothetical protein
MTMARLPRLLFAVVVSLLAPWAGSAQAANLVLNPGFENGAASWTQVSTFANVITEEPTAAHAGSWDAWLGGYHSGSDTLSQDIAIPASATDARLQFWYRINTEESSAAAYDTLAISLTHPATGATLATLANFSNQTQAAGWTLSSAYDVSAFRGQTVRLTFAAVMDHSYLTSFRIDDVALTTSAPAAATTNYSDIWWNPSESGWGLTIADHETQLFVVWYTYRPDGRPVWYVIPGGTFSSGRRIFTGDAYVTTGPPYTAASFNQALVTVNKVGTVTLDFAPPGLATGTVLFSYSVNNVSQTRQIQRQPFGSAAPDWGRDYTDIYYNAGESGWGVTLAQHGDNIFGVFYLYDTDGQPIWVVMPGGTFSGSVFSGAVYTTTGPAFNAQPFDPNAVRSTHAGNATFTLAPKRGDKAGALAVPALACSANFLLNLRGTSWIKCVDPQVFGNLPVTGGHGVTITPRARQAIPINVRSTIGIADASGGAGPPYQFYSDTFANGAPPYGMTILNDAANSSVGVLSGTPSVAGVYTYGVCVKDVGGHQACSQVQTQVCQLSISPSGVSATASGGSSVITVSAGAGCNWTATSNVSWISISINAAANTVSYTVAANTGGARTGTVTVAGFTFTVSQSAGGGGGGGFYYANWNCAGPQCAAVMGGTAGTQGPFCTPANCESWRQAFITTSSCSTTPTYAPVPGGSSCFTYP